MWEVLGPRKGCRARVEVRQKKMVQGPKKSLLSRGFTVGEGGLELSLKGCFVVLSGPSHAA